MAGSIWAGMGPTWRDPQEITGEAYREGALTGAGFAQAFSSAFDKAAERNSLQGQLQMKELQTQLDMQTLDLADRNKEVAAQSEDAQSLAPWLTLTPDKRIETPLPAAPKSKWGWQQVQKTQQGDEAFSWRKEQSENRSLATQIAIKDQTEFIKGLEQASPADRAQIRAMTPNKDGSPSPMMWQALGLAQESSQLRTDNARVQAEIEARQRGDEVTTTLGPKGETTRFSPPKSGGSSEIKTVKLPDGTTAAYMEGSKSMHIIKSGVDAMRAKAALKKKDEAEIAYRTSLSKSLSPTQADAINKYRDEANREFDALFSKTVDAPPGVEADAPPPPEGAPAAPATNPKDPLGLGL